MDDRVRKMVESLKEIPDDVIREMASRTMELQESLLKDVIRFLPEEVSVQDLLDTLTALTVCQAKVVAFMVREGAVSMESGKKFVEFIAPVWEYTIEVMARV